MATQDEIIINYLVKHRTARELAEELVKRCACSFDHRLPDNAPPVLECDYHRQLRESSLEQNRASKKKPVTEAKLPLDQR